MNCEFLSSVLIRKYSFWFTDILWFLDDRVNSYPFLSKTFPASQLSNELWLSIQCMTTSPTLTTVSLKIE